MEIYVDLNGLDRAFSDYKRLANEISHVQSSFRNITNSLDFDIKSKADIQNYINNLNNQLSQADRTINAYASFLRDTKDTYFEADEYAIKQANELKSDLFGGKYQSGAGSNSIGITNNGADSHKDENGKLGDFTRNYLLKLFSKYGGVILSTVSSLILIGSDVKSLIESFKSGSNCIGSLVTNIIRKAKGMFSGAVSMIKKISDYYKNSKQAYFISEKFAKGVDSISDAIKYTGKASKVSAKIFAGVGVALDTLFRGFESVNAYSADGEFSNTDLRDTIIDVSCTGVISGVITAVTAAAPPLGLALGVVNSVLGIDKGISTLIKTGLNEGFDGVKSLVANKVDSLVNGIRNEVGNAVQSVVNGCSSMLSKFIKPAFA